MAKRTPTRRAGSSAPSAAELRRMDRELVRLLNKRTALAAKLAQARLDQGGSLYDPQAENEQLEEAVAHNGGPLPEAALRAVLRELLSGARGLVKPLRIAYLGPPYSYSHLAAIERYGQTPELVPVLTIAAVFEEVNRGQVDFGMVPIENSTDGRVADTLDMFARLPARICGEVQLHIHHCLLGRCARGEVQEVYSKPQALSQCRDWLARYLPHARAVEMTSTAAAARLAADKPGAAAIASLQAAATYGLNVIAENIEDNPRNITRFAVIGEQDSRRTGKDKTALMFELQHQSGALADALAVLKRARLNMTWIESFPMRSSKSEYLFFVEVEGHQNEAKVKKALASLERKTQRLVVLGSYAAAPPV